MMEDASHRGGAAGGPTELEDLQCQANTKTDESLESTRRMLALAEESKDAGMRTLVMLDEQGEQLDRVEEGMDRINTDMGEAEKNLTSMDKCCGLCVMPWKRKKIGEKTGAFASTWGKGSGDDAVNLKGPRVHVNEGEMHVSGSYVTRVTDDAREDEMENNIGEVSGMISNLRNMAVDLGSEIDSQNRQVDRIHTKATSLDGRVNDANSRTKKLINAKTK